MHDIAVGVDGTEHAAEALRWAVEEGRTTGRPVTAVLVWGPSISTNRMAVDASWSTMGR